MRIVLGVGGGIAAYKVASLLRLFTEAGHDVTVIPTEAATRFVGVATWEALSGHPVSNSVFDDVHTVNHVRLGHEAELIVVAPATADLLARAATGQANDLLTNTLLMAGDCPVLMAPAMHTEMWQHPATQANVETLRSRGVTVLEPASGRLTGADSGPGRLPEPEAIFQAAMTLAGASAARPASLTPPDAGRHQSRGDPRWRRPSAAGPLAGLTVTISAGGTREPLDPVRFLGNRSSGKQGVALAAAAREAGARVRLLAAHMEVPAPAGVERRRGGDRPGAAQGGAARGRRFRRRHHGRRRRGLPPGGRLRNQNQEARRRRRSRHLPGPQPRHPAGTRRGPRRRVPESADRRLRGRDRATPTATSWTMPGPSCAARPATCWWSTRWARTGFSARTRTP